MTTTIQVPDIPPYIITQPEDYIMYHHSQRSKWYASLGANNVICDLLRSKCHNYCRLLKDYQPYRQIYYPGLGLLPQNHVNR